ncbi:MAG TPA: CHAD domain-containing protein, partial [Spirochaetia bacterium]|nr:CHAD domain-containing protein [Spirochaetia bacterium]
LGYRFRVRLRREENRLYFDTQAGSLFRQRAELYYESRHSTWHFLRDGMPVQQQKGMADGPPTAGAAARAIRELAGDHHAIAYLETAVEETLLGVAGISGSNVGLSVRVWQLISPLHEARPRTLVTLAFDSEGAAPFAVDYVARLLAEALGLEEQGGTELRLGLSLLGVPFPGAPLPSGFLPAPGDDTAAVCAKVLSGEAWRMKANTPGAVRDLDAEFVHDLRVATRRARFACRLFVQVIGAERSKKIRLELSWIAGLLGGVRDMDVLRMRVESQLTRIEADEAFQSSVAGVLQDRGGRARELLVPALLSERYAALLTLMSAPLEDRGPREPAENFGRRRIGKALEKIAPWTHQQPDALTPEQLHRLRILFKRLRYTVEYFRPILGQGATLLARECVAFQDCLGLHQDARVASGVLAGLATEPVVSERPAGLMMLGALIQVQRETMLLQRERFRTLWGAVESLFDLWKSPPPKVRP